MFYRQRRKTPSRQHRYKVEYATILESGGERIVSYGLSMDTALNFHRLASPDTIIDSLRIDFLAPRRMLTP